MDNCYSLNGITLFCKKCNFKAKSPASWLIHLNSKKHSNVDNCLLKSCDLCDKTFSNHFKLKMHNLANHATIEQKRNFKYYCHTCDLIFISEIFMVRHIFGKHHKNVIRVLESINKAKDEIIYMQKIYEFYKIKKYFNIYLANQNNILFDNLQYIYSLNYKSNEMV